MTLDVVGGMLDGLDAWMTEKSFETIDDFKGYMSYKTVKDSSIYERAQFMKYFSNHG
jgi:dihydroorotate dehydrogenase (fumarate)